MGTKTHKHTRAAKRRVSKTTERPATPLEQAEAVIYVHDQGGRKVAPARNPFFQATGSIDTIQYVKCGLEVMSNSTLRGSGAAESADVDFGRYLLLQTLADALEAAKEQIKVEHELARASATVAALKRSDGGAQS